MPRFSKDRFFSPTDIKRSPSGANASKPIAPDSAPAVPVPRETSAQKSIVVLQKPSTEAPAVPTYKPDKKAPGPAPEAIKTAAREAAAPAVAEVNLVNDDCLSVLACETGLDITDFINDAFFIELGVDSLMSFVLSEKCHNKVQLEF